MNDFINKKEEFLNNVFTNSTYLEDLTGLTDLKNQFENTEVHKFKNNVLQVCNVNIFLDSGNE